MRLLAPAKINLHLRVGPPMADGFHPLLSWMCTVGFFDILQMQLATVRSGPLIALECDDPRLPSDEMNLVVRGGILVAQAIAATREGAAMQPIRVQLSKRIATAAGMGGGSSDAARAMLGLNQLWKGKLGRNALAVLSAQCGSDIPFFFFGASSICSGRGEIVQPIASPKNAKWVVLIFPPIMMPTPAVYRKFDELKLGRERNVCDQPQWHEWLELTSNEMLQRLVNDLEPAAFAIRADLGELRSAAQKKLGRPVRMSGSGSTLFSLFDIQPDAQRAATDLMQEFDCKAIAVELAPMLNDDLNALL